jgi:hypothetical protein
MVSAGVINPAASESDCFRSVPAHPVNKAVVKTMLIRIVILLSVFIVS